MPVFVCSKKEEQVAALSGFNYVRFTVRGLFGSLDPWENAFDHFFFKNRVKNNN